MIPNSFSVNNNFIVTPFQEVSQTPLNLSLENKKLIVHDRIVQHLIQTKIMNLDGSFNLESLKLNLSLLENKIIERLGLMLYNQFTIKSTAIHPFEFSISLQELFSNLDIHNIEIIGGTVYSLLGPEIIQELARILKIPAEWIDEDFLEEYKNPAADIDIRVHVTDDPQNWLNKVVAFFQSKLINIDEHRIQKEAFTNYFIYNPNPLDHFGIVSFGDPLDVSIDLIFEKDLKRKNLFKHDAFKFDIAYFGTPFCRVKPSTHNIPILEAMILRLTKTIDADNPDEVDIKGSAKLLIFLSKGFRWQSNELKTKLLTKFLLSKKYDKLEKITKNHFPNQPQALLFICFNSFHFLPSICKNQLIDLAKSLLPDVFEDAKNPILNLIHKLMLPLKTANLNPLQGKAVINLIACFLQFFKGFNSVDVTSSHTLIEDELFFRFKFNLPKPLYLVVNDSSDSLLSLFTDSFNSIDLELKKLLSALFHQLSTHFTFSAENGFKMNAIDVEAITKQLPAIEDSKTAFVLLEDDQIFLKQLGFYSLISFGIKEKTSKDLPHLIAQFFAFLTKEDSITIKMNLFSAFITYWSTVCPDELKTNEKEMENFYKALSNPNCKLDDILKSFCINFAGVNHETIKKIVFKTLAEKPEIFNEQSYLLLIEKFSKQSPRHALLLIIECIKTFPNSVTKCKKSYDLLFKKYLEPKNKALLYVDCEKLAQVSLSLSFENTEKAESYIQLAKVLVETDPLFGMQFINTLEEKKLISSAVAQEERILLLLESLNSKEELEQKTKLNGELFDILKNIALSKKTISNKLKNALKPKLETLLIWKLQANKDHAAIKDAITLCFKIAECFYPEIVNASSLHSNLIEKFNQLLTFENNLTHILFIKEYLKNKKTYSEEELLLFENLIEKTLALKDVKVTEELLRKVLLYTHSKSKLPQDTILNHIDAFLKELEIENKSLPFLNFIEELFPKLQILNKDQHYKTAILNLPEKNKIKKAEFFCKMSETILKDKKMLLEVEKFWISLLADLFELKNPESKNPEWKNKEEKEKIFQKVLTILEKFNFTNPHQINHLAATLLKLNNKSFCKTSYSKLLECQVPVTSLLPIFHVLDKISPDFFILYLDKYKKDLAKFEGKCGSALKQEYVSLLILNFLKLLENKKIDVFKIYEAFSLLEKEQPKNLDVLFFKSFLPSITDTKFFQLYWSRVEPIFDKVKTEREFKEKHNPLSNFFEFLVTESSHFEKSIVLKKLLSDLLDSFSSDMEKLKALSTIPWFFELFFVNTNVYSLDFFADLIEKNLKNLPNNLSYETAIKKDPDCIAIKNFLKKIVAFSLANKSYKISEKFLSLTYFEKDELFGLEDLFLKMYFNDPIALMNPRLINKSLLIFTSHFTKTNKSLEFQLEDLKKAIDLLLGSVFFHDEKIEFFHCLRCISLNFSYSFEKSAEYFEFLEILTVLGKNDNDYLPHLKIDLEKNKITATDGIILREKFWQFLLILAQKCTMKLNKEDLILTKTINDAGMFNCLNLSAMVKIFPEKKDEIITTVLDYCYVTPQFNLSSYDEYIKGLSLTFTLMQENNFFKEFSSNSIYEKSFELMIFTKSKSDLFITLNDKRRAEIILSMAKKMLGYKFYHHFVLTHHFLNNHEEFLKKNIKKEYDTFIKSFNAEFKKKYPHHAANQVKKLTESMINRHNDTLFPIIYKRNPTDLFKFFEG